VGVNEHGPTHEPGDALDFVDDLLDEEEAERVAALPRAAVLAELAENGLDPARARAVVERVLARPEGAAGALERAPGAVASASDAHASWGRSEDRSRIVWIAVALAAGVALALGIAKRDAIVAWWTPAPPAPVPVPSVMPPARPWPEEHAEALRREALDDCAKGDFADCANKLDVAEVFDPAGETAPGVQEARAAIRKERERPPVRADKPKR
jgi:hypothetical protein